ncbi:MAG: SDR family oxidoreductase [Rhodospirillaceae bacterium]|nr:SDR family oxidoreductase [Rhodospirillales bacterium]
MRVLVTGHLGYVGPIVLRQLKEAGHWVAGLDCGYFRDCTDAHAALTRPDREWIADIRDMGAEVVRGMDAVIHLAGLSNDPMGQLDPGLTAAINHRATIRLARMAQDEGVGRFIFASSCSLYGASGDAARPLDEDAPLAPVSAYARSKADCETDLAALATGGFAPFSLRFATAYGLSPRMRLDLVLNNLTSWARATGVVRVMSDGTPWRPLVHIEDMAQAMLCALTAPVGERRAFNVGRDDDNLRVAEIADIVSRQIPGSRVEITGDAGGDPRSYRVDFSRVSQGLPGFAPRWSVTAGCEQIDRWLCDRKLSTAHIQSRHFVRLGQLQHLRKGGVIDDGLRLMDVLAC